MVLLHIVKVIADADTENVISMPIVKCAKPKQKLLLLLFGKSTRGISILLWMPTNVLFW